MFARLFINAARKAACLSPVLVQIGTEFIFSWVPAVVKCVFRHGITRFLIESGVIVVVRIGTVRIGVS